MNDNSFTNDAPRCLNSSNSASGPGRARHGPAQGKKPGHLHRSGVCASGSARRITPTPPGSTHDSPAGIFRPRGRHREDRRCQAGVFRLRPDLAIVNTVDFFTPIVDDPYMFGQIAAANALSDVYAMGGDPKTALNIVGFPKGKLDLEVPACRGTRLSDRRVQKDSRVSRRQDRRRAIDPGGPPRSRVRSADFGRALDGAAPGPGLRSCRRAARQRRDGSHRRRARDGP